MGWGGGLVYSGESERERSVWAVPVRGCRTPVGYSSVYPYVGVQSSAGVFKTQQGGYLCHVVAWRGVLEFKWSGGRGPPALAEAAEMGDLSQTRY